MCMSIRQFECMFVLLVYLFVCVHLYLCISLVMGMFFVCVYVCLSGYIPE